MRTRLVSHNADRFTGIVPQRTNAIASITAMPEHKERTKRLHEILINGARWEDSSGVSLDKFVAATSSKKTKPKFVKKRLGAKAVKAHELLENTGTVLMTFRLPRTGRLQRGQTI